MVALAKKFSNMADGYLLGEKSLSHVTLYQFQAEEKEIDYIWEKISGMWKEKPVYLAFNKFSCITFDNDIFWVSLLPDNCDILHKMHGFIASILKFPIKKSFDPHMTLINTKDKEYEKEVAKFSDLYKPITDTFILSMGISDDIGQLTEIVYRYDMK